MTGGTERIREFLVGPGGARRPSSPAVPLAAVPLAAVLLAGAPLGGAADDAWGQASIAVPDSSMEALRSMFPGGDGAEKGRPPMQRGGMRPPAPAVPPNLVTPSRPVAPPPATILDTGNAGSATPRAGIAAPAGLAPVTVGKPRQPRPPGLTRARPTPTPPRQPAISSGMPSVEIEPRVKNRNTAGPAVPPDPPRGSKKAALRALDNAIGALPNIGGAIAIPSDGGSWPALGNLAPFLAAARATPAGAKPAPSGLPEALPIGTLPARLTDPAGQDAAAAGPAGLLPGVAGGSEKKADTPKATPQVAPKSKEARRKKDDATFKAWDKQLNQAVKHVDFVSEEGLTFKGKQTRDKRFKGVITYPDGGRYEGQAVKGKRHGEGKMSYPNGGIYEGDWVGDEWHGEGVAIVANGNRYEGGYIKGKKQGQGVYQWADGGRYEGGFLQGGFHGKGMRTFANGNKYVGDWKIGMRHGLGIMTYHDGDRYEGDWRDDKRHGQGAYAWRTGDRYEGEWVDGKRHGEGVFIFADGRRYEGPWRYDYRHGQGTMILRDGRKVTGMWFYGRGNAENEAKNTANRQ